MATVFCVCMNSTDLYYLTNYRNYYRKYLRTELEKCTQMDSKLNATRYTCVGDIF